MYSCRHNKVGDGIVSMTAHHTAEPGWVRRKQGRKVAMKANCFTPQQRKVRQNPFLEASFYITIYPNPPSGFTKFYHPKLSKAQLPIILPALQSY